MHPLIISTSNVGPNGPEVRRRGSPFWFLLLCLAAVGPAQAGNAEVGVTVATALEYDDNVTLASTPGAETESDLVFRLGPSVGVRLPWQDHDFSLDLSADYRRGLDTGITDANISARAGVNLNFPGGLRLSFSDAYSKTGFDQELREEAGTPDSDSNRIQLAASYAFGQRLKAEASYSRQEQDFDLEGRSSAVDRVIDAVEGTFFVPVTRSAVAHVSYSLEHQDSPDRTERTYRNDSYRLGLSWETPHRLSLRLELGQGSLDFDQTEQDDFDGIVTEIGARLKLTERTSAELAVGRDEFGELSYDGGLTYQNETDFRASLSFSRQTRPSFSFVFDSAVVHSERVALSVGDQLANRFSVSLSADYQLQESAFSDEKRNDRLVSASLEVSYPVQKWMKLGGHYRYAWRTSNDESLDFTGNRFGLNATFSH